MKQSCILVHTANDSWCLSRKPCRHKRTAPLQKHPFVLNDQLQIMILCEVSILTARCQIVSDLGSRPLTAAGSVWRCWEQTLDSCVILEIRRSTSFASECSGNRNQSLLRNFSALMQSAIQSTQLTSEEPPLNPPYWSSSKLRRSKNFVSSSKRRLLCDFDS
jgi:hypothetical protein